jgi:hypothetical protein
MPAQNCLPTDCTRIDCAVVAENLSAKVSHDSDGGVCTNCARATAAKRPAALITFIVFFTNKAFNKCTQLVCCRHRASRVWATNFLQRLDRAALLSG